MKTTSKSAKNAYDDRSVRQANGSTEPASFAGNDNIPREQLIAEAAYFRSERRGFVPGNEMSDWLDAEADIERMFGNQATVPCSS
jgi:hypothetical protein